MPHTLVGGVGKHEASFIYDIDAGEGGRERAKERDEKINKQMKRRPR
jgi:hypothetical protein